jgi:hypothetical protein
MQQGMDPLVKDWIQVISWGVAIVGGLVAAIVALSQFAVSNKQRKRELRWQQAKAGKELIDEMFDDKKASEAMRMLDFPGDEFSGIPSADKKVFLSDIPNALEVETGNDNDFTFVHKDEKSVFIRDRFDGFLYYLERCEYFRENGLVEFRDIRVPVEYYAKIIAKKMERAFVRYAQTIGYLRATRFLEDLKPVATSLTAPKPDSAKR